MQKMSVCLWFDHQAEEAARFYTSIFEDGKIEDIVPYTAEGPGPEGSTMTITFHINGQEFMALNGGPVFQFTPAISLMVYCDNQAEVDYYWDKLTEGGREDQCGWLTDKYGVSWQIVPKSLVKMMTSPETGKVSNMTKAMFQMKKLDIDTLEKAFASG